MSETVEAVAARLGLKPDPAAGWFAPTDGEAGRSAYRQLVIGGDGLPWHEVAAETRWRHVGGAPGLVSFMLPTGEVGARQVRPGAPPIVLSPGTRQVIDSAGVWTLFEVGYAPALPLTDRAYAPDDWHPDPASPVIGTPLA